MKTMLMCILYDRDHEEAPIKDSCCLVKAVELPFMPAAGMTLKVGPKGECTFVVERLAYAVDGGHLLAVHSYTCMEGRDYKREIASLKKCGFIEGWEWPDDEPA